MRAGFQTAVSQTWLVCFLLSRGWVCVFMICSSRVLGLGALHRPWKQFMSCRRTRPSVHSPLKLTLRMYLSSFFPPASSMSGQIPEFSGQRSRCMLCSACAMAYTASITNWTFPSCSYFESTPIRSWPVRKGEDTKSGESWLNQKWLRVKEQWSKTSAFFFFLKIRLLLIGIYFLWVHPKSY